MYDKLECGAANTLYGDNSTIVNELLQVCIFFLSIFSKHLSDDDEKLETCRTLKNFAAVNLSDPILGFDESKARVYRARAMATERYRNV